jgi:hypothetical protein
MCISILKYNQAKPLTIEDFKLNELSTSSYCGSYLAKLLDGRKDYRELPYIEKVKAFKVELKNRLIFLKNVKNISLNYNGQKKYNSKIYK